MTVLGRSLVAIVTVGCCALAMPAAMAAADEAATQTVDFARDLRPLLSNRCFQCHGPDAKRREAELRLDTAAGIASVLKAGKPAKSEILRRLTSDDPDERMPPPKSGKKLSDDEITLVRRWIEQGARGGGHWAFTPPVRPAIPQVEDTAWVRNPVDAFVLARLEHEGLKPSPEAERAVLLRRLSLDLTGLPPTIDELSAFESDDSPDAYQKQIRRLLASPHYGERWGRHWLDAARYADSDGYEKDKPRTVWFYRDWVIDALNRDLPYDQFVIEQIAGDQLPDATQQQIVATGFLRNSMINEEGGIDPEQFRMEAMFDRMDAVGKSVLGLTIQCAQCHDHKFDPLRQVDYYRMFAFLNNAHEGNVTVYTPAEQMQRAELLREIHRIEAGLKEQQPDWQQQMARWEASVRDDQPTWHVLRPEVDEISTGGQKYLPQDDGSLLAQGYAPTKHTVKLTAQSDLKKITAIRLELLTDPNLPRGGPGRSIFGTAALTEFEVDAAPADQPGKAKRIKFSQATADVNPPETPLAATYDDRSKKRRVTGPVGFAIDGNELTAWGSDAGPGRRNQPRKAVFTVAEPIAHEGGTALTIHLSQKHGGWNSDDNQNHNLGRFRLSVTDDPNATADPLPVHVRQALAIASDKRTPAQTESLFSYWRTTVPEWREANEAIEALWKKHPEGTTQLALLARDERRPTHVLQRGDFLKPQAEVSPGVPDFLHPLPKDAPPTRLTFARWLVDRRSPTTARAIVNRIWQSYFGTGLVSTSEDLGSQSETPSHPELLDWLAVELMDSGWRLKHLHELIVSSNTYRQSSRVSPELLARDPNNRLLARGPRVRVEAEIVRDIALAASGLLNPQVGGPSVFPPAPEFLFQPPASYGPKVWNESTGSDRYRRAMYTFRFRSVPFPALESFDAPNGDFSCVRRARSNTPLQALTTLNEPLFVECARALALRVVREGGANDDARIAFAFRLCTARKPTKREAEVLLGLLTDQTKRFSADGADPWQLAAGDPKHPPALPEGVVPAQLAAWTAVSRVLLNLDETITKE